MVISDGNPDGGVWQEELTLAGEDLLLFFCVTLPSYFMLLVMQEKSVP